MFRLVGEGGGDRLVADARLLPSDFKRIAESIGRPVLQARKIGYVAARRAQAGEVVDTHWNGRETTNMAREGDWVVVTLSPERKVLRDRDGRENAYVVPGARFAELYEPAGEQLAGGQVVYRAKGTVSAIDLPGGFDIVAPWGERQHAAAGYLILNGDEVYGNTAEIFEATYQVVCD